MTTFRLLWQIHKWTGITIGVLVLVSSITGVLLLVKKNYAWLQPPTQVGTAGPVDAIRPIHEIYAAVFALELPQLRSEDDVSRIDFRPGKRVFKVRSKHDDLEVQVDAISLKTWEPATRRSDVLERIHDGQWLGAWAHGLLMPMFGLAMVVLTITGYLLWIWPGLVKRRKRVERLAS